MPNYLQLFTVLLLMIVLTSCSYFGRRNKDFEGNKVTPKKSANQTVPKAKYDALLKRYNQLSLQVKRSSGERVSEELMNELANTPKAELAETVDAFGSNRKKRPAWKAPAIGLEPDVDVPDREVEKQLDKLRKARELLDAGKFDEALGFIKRDIEKSPIKQVRVRAKFLLGELLLRQNEYDLAMQMFEEIISNYAFSGIVIKTLGRLIHCSDKLNLEDKKEKYFSMLNDIFGTG